MRAKAVPASVGSVTMTIFLFMAGLDILRARTRQLRRALGAPLSPAAGLRTCTCPAARTSWPIGAS